MASSIKVYCYDCDKITNHENLFSAAKEETYPDYDENNDIEDVTRKMSYNVVLCLGCETHSFLETTAYSNDLDENDEPIIYTALYPDPEEFENEEENGFYLGGDEIRALPPLVKNLYKEVIVAFRNDLDILAGMGLRALLEALCMHRNITGRNLKLKIENLHKEGYISRREMPILQKLREIGNSTVHQIRKPSSAVLDNALGIINHTLKTVYYIPKVDAKIKSKSKSGERVSFK